MKSIQPSQFRYRSTLVVLTMIFAVGSHLAVGPIAAQFVVNPLTSVSKSTVSGLVIDEAGDPVKGAIVVWGHGPMSVNSGFVIVSDDGTFKTSPQPDGTGRITVFAPGFSPDTKEIKITPGMAETEFVLEPGVKLHPASKSG